MVLSSWGFNEPLPAAMRVATPNNPANYNADYLKSPIDIKIPAPKIKIRKPTKNQDRWGYTTARKKISPAVPRNSYNTTYLKLSNINKLKTPAPNPYTKELGLAELRKTRGADPDAPAEKTDYVDIAIKTRDLFAPGSERYEYWSRQIYKLGVIDHVKKRRPLTVDEEAAESEIIAELNDFDADENIIQDEDIPDFGDMPSDDEDAPDIRNDAPAYVSDSDESDEKGPPPVNILMRDPNTVYVVPDDSLRILIREFERQGVRIADPHMRGGRNKMAVLDDLIKRAEAMGVNVVMRN